MVGEWRSSGAILTAGSIPVVQTPKNETRCACRGVWLNGSSVGFDSLGCVGEWIRRAKAASVCLKGVLYENDGERKA